MLIVFLSGCTQDKNTQSESSDNDSKIESYKEENKRLDKKVIALKDSIQHLNALLNPTTMVTKNDLLYQEDKSAIDSLRNLLKMSLEANKTLKQRNQFTSKDQVAIKQMVYDLHDAFEQLPESGKPEDVTHFFLPRYSFHQVLIDQNNEGHISGYTHDDFTKHLNQLDKQKNKLRTFFDLEILDITVKDRLFFNVMYACRVKEYSEGRLLSENDLSVIITGKRADSHWKIANYSSTEFEYPTQP